MSANESSTSGPSGLGDIAGASFDEADRLIAAALADHVRIPAPRKLRDQLARQHLVTRRPWRALFSAFALGAGVAAAIVFILIGPPSVVPAIVNEAVGDHLRIVSSLHPLDVESSDVHNVKPWFSGRLDFVPPVSFIGDEDFKLRGGEVAVFLGHKAAAFVYQRRLHTISLFVFADSAAPPRAETTVRGFHVLTWSTGGLAMTLVSDVAWEDMRLLESRLRT